MSRYQRATLLILLLILITVVALVAVVALKSPTQTIIATTPTTMFSSDEMTETWAVEYIATNRATFEALATEIMGTVTSP